MRAARKKKPIAGARARFRSLVLRVPDVLCSALMGGSAECYSSGVDALEASARVGAWLVARCFIWRGTKQAHPAMRTLTRTGCSRFCCCSTLVGPPCGPCGAFASPNPNPLFPLSLNFYRAVEPTKRSHARTGRQVVGGRVGALVLPGTLRVRGRLAGGVRRDGIRANSV